MTNYLKRKRRIEHPLKQLLPHAQIMELEVLSLSSGELTAIVDTLTQIIHDAVVAVDARIGLAVGHKGRVTIFVLTSRRNEHHTLEVHFTLIPSRMILIETRYDAVTLIATVFFLATLTHTFLCLEIGHIGGNGLDNYEVNVGTHLVALRKHHIASGIFSQVSLKFRRHIKLKYRAQETNRLLYRRDKRFIIKITDI